MSHTALETLECNPGGAPAATVIWLHGLGANMHDFEPIVPQLGLGPDLPIRFVFPNAPQRPVTINGGMVMRAWFDIFELSPDGREDESGIREADEALRELILAEKSRGIAPQRVVVAGFSQGGAVALHTGTRFPERLAGIIALSTYLPLHRTLAGERSEANAGLPIFMAHGTEDAVVPISLGRASAQLLTASGYEVDWREYEMGHAVCPAEIAAIGEWLADNLGAPPP